MGDSKHHGKVEISDAFQFPLEVDMTVLQPSVESGCLSCSY